MKKILHSRLPQRLAHRVPPLAVELTVGAATAVAMVAIRAAFAPFAGDRAPYALNFLAVVIACVVAGWRAGLVALAIGQLLIWYMVVPPYWSMAIGDPERFGGLILATVAQLLILAIIALYQREIDKGTAERDRRMDLLDHALREIDHRTRNNYQTVLALVHLQAQRSKDPDVKGALQQVADRIQAIANASERLALHSGEIERVRLDDHLCGLCEQIERGLSRQNVNVECRVEEITASPEKAIPIAIIVNELVTNALKHAFDGRDEGRVVVSAHINGQLKVIVADNGHGMKRATAAAKRGGLGTRLVESFTRQLGAEHQVTSSNEGTTHQLVIPGLD